MCKFRRIRWRNRRRLFRVFHDWFESSPRLKLLIMIILLLPMVYIIIRVTHIDRIKILVLDKESDIESSSAQGKWSIQRWDYVTDGNLHSLFKEYGISPVGLKNEAKDGFWVAAKKRNENTAQESYSFHLDKFQYHYPVETSIALRFYIVGSGKLEIIFRDAFLWEINTYVISPNPDYHAPSTSAHPSGEISKNHTFFCSHIIPLTFDGLVDKVEIKATVETSESFVAVDSLFATMGKHGGSRNLMLTMIPKNWCTNEYLHNWYPNDPKHTNSIQRRNVMRYR